jgi:hypothetical protein
MAYTTSEKEPIMGFDELRKEYTVNSLTETTIAADPLSQFHSGLLKRRPAAYVNQML